jgi:hypothetical protein
MNRLAFGLLFLWTGALHALPSYRVFDLPALGGSATTTTGAYDISENGWVAGYSGGGTGQRAVRWAVSASGAGAPLNLGLLPSATSSVAYGVDDHGHVVGSSSGRAFAWIPPLYTGLHPIPLPAGAPAGARCIAAYSINQDDRVVGRYARLGTAPPYWAFHWAPGQATALFGSPEYHMWRGATAFAINSFGAFVGSAERWPTGGQQQVEQAFAWTQPGFLGAFPGPPGSLGWSTAFGLNDDLDDLDIVGESEGYAFHWTPALGMTQVAAGAARDINNWDDIIGFTSTYAWVRYAGSPTAYNLNALIPANSGWTLLEAYGLNDLGWIVGIGRKTTPTGGLSGEEGEQTIQVVRGFLLIPQ